MKNEFEQIKNEFESYFKEKINSYQNIPYPLKDSICYSALSGGKRFRPVLFIKTCRMFGRDDEGVMLFASAIEALHNYTLIHDDLPALDNDDYRRGRLTNHKVFGEDIAILAGDSLLNFAYELVFESIRVSKNQTAALAAAAKFAHLCGAESLIAGQTADMQNLPEGERGEKALEYIYTHKTCDLINAACECAALFCDATNSEVDAMRSFAYSFGYAFQLEDDYLDKDDENRGFSCFDIYSEAEVIDMIKEYSDNALKALSLISKDTSFFKNLTIEFTSRKN